MSVVLAGRARGAGRRILVPADAKVPRNQAQPVCPGAGREAPQSTGQRPDRQGHSSSPGRCWRQTRRRCRGCVLREEAHVSYEQAADNRVLAHADRRPQVTADAGPHLLHAGDAVGLTKQFPGLRDPQPRGVAEEPSADHSVVRVVGLEEACWDRWQDGTGSPGGRPGCWKALICRGPGWAAAVAELAGAGLRLTGAAVGAITVAGISLFRASLMRQVDQQVRSDAQRLIGHPLVAWSAPQPGLRGGPAKISVEALAPLENGEFLWARVARRPGHPHGSRLDLGTRWTAGDGARPRRRGKLASGRRACPLPGPPSAVRVWGR